MKNLLLILLFFTVVLPVVGQTDSVEITNNVHYKNKVILDVDFIGSNISYERVISEKWSLSSGIGAGVVFVLDLEKLHNNSYHEPDGNPQFFNITTLMNYNFSKKFTTTLGIKYAVMMFGDVSFGSFLGTELGFFYMIKTIKIGIKGILGGFEGDIFIGSSLITIKIPLKQW